jgi:hypothetical protein
MARDHVTEAAIEVAIDIAVLSERSGVDIEQIVAALEQRCGQTPSDMAGIMTAIITTARGARDRIARLRRDFHKVADEEGLPHDNVNEWLAKAIKMLSNGEMRQSDLD